MSVFPVLPRAHREKTRFETSGRCGMMMGATGLTPGIARTTGMTPEGSPARLPVAVQREDKTEEFPWADGKRANAP